MKNIFKKVFCKHLDHDLEFLCNCNDDESYSDIFKTYKSLYKCPDCGGIVGRKEKRKNSDVVHEKDLALMIALIANSYRELSWKVKLNDRLIVGIKTPLGTSKFEFYDKSFYILFNNIEEIDLQEFRKQKSFDRIMDFVDKDSSKFERLYSLLSTKVTYGKTLYDLHSDYLLNDKTVKYFIKFRNSDIPRILPSTNSIYGNIYDILDTNLLNEKVYKIKSIDKDIMCIIMDLPETFEIKLNTVGEVMDKLKKGANVDEL